MTSFRLWRQQTEQTDQESDPKGERNRFGSGSIQQYSCSSLEIHTANNKINQFKYHYHNDNRCSDSQRSIVSFHHSLCGRSQLQRWRQEGNHSGTGQPIPAVFHQFRHHETTADGNHRSRSAGPNDRSHLPADGHQEQAVRLQAKTGPDGSGATGRGGPAEQSLVWSLWFPSTASCVILLKKY